MAAENLLDRLDMKALRVEMRRELRIERLGLNGLVEAMAEIEEAEECLRSAHERLRALLAEKVLPEGGDDAR
jgi:hypothetical protein